MEEEVQKKKPKPGCKLIAILGFILGDVLSTLLVLIWHFVSVRYKTNEYSIDNC